MIHILLILSGISLLLFYSSYYCLVLLESRKNKTKRPFETSVSIIIPTYNEEKTIEQKLQNVGSQDYTGKMEILVVDSSTDGTLETVKHCAGTDPCIRVLHEETRRGKAFALNQAFPVCSGEIIVITDADAIWARDTLKEAIMNFSDPEVGAVTGRQILLNPTQTRATETERVYRKFYEILRIAESNIDSTPIFHGELACYRRDLLEKVTENSMADDSELALSVRKKGARSIYDPKSVFFEYAPPTWRSRYIQKVRRGQGLQQLFCRNWRILFNSTYGRFGLVVYPAEFFMHVVSPNLVLLFVITLLWTAIKNFLGYFLVLALGLTLLYLISGKTLETFATFFQSQFILIISLIRLISGHSQHVWPQVEEIRDLWEIEMFESNGTHEEQGVNRHHE
ncbi:MAG: glycosyltransferase [Theionarchaea archaeon]|nr:glycosyltransferase [Theionarchaea archaeon]MBU7038448.1 glycosyltransferase [Theionarchaea archaeon]